MSERWTPREHHALDLYLTGKITGRDLLSERIRRSKRAIRDKITRLGVRKHKYRLWTPAEDARLLELGRIRWRPKLEYTSAFPGRTYGAIKKRLHVLRYRDAKS